MDLRKVLSRNVRGRLMDALWWLPDAPYVQLFYFAINSRFPNIKNPKGYNEKLQWLKLHDKHPEYRELVDKLRVREIIKEKLGEEYLFPILGYWDRFSDIDFDSLPNEFVLKCNHDSGSVKIIKDKAALSQQEIAELKKFYDRRVKYDFFYAGREYPYKGIKPCIIAEKLMKDGNGEAGGIRDYKFFCFDGQPRLMLYVSGRQTRKHEDYFDMDYNWLREIRNGSTSSEFCPEKPVTFEEMKRLCTILSAGMKEVRMDFYEIDGRPYFGEFTFFSGGGFELFHPTEWERQLGDWIRIEVL